MANSSIYAAFERMWQHVTAAVGSKASINHTHDDVYYTEVEIDSKLESKANVSHNHDDRYYTETEIDLKLDETKAYADTVGVNVKNELLNGAGEAYDTLKELGDLITENVDAIEALETVATNKADKEHNHDNVYETKENVQLKYDTITEAKADWSQNDETALDYIKNRTHWVEVGKELLLEEQTTTSTGLSDQMQNCYSYSGETFIVTVDGVEYNCVSWDFNGETYIGDSRTYSIAFDDPNTDLAEYHPEDVPFLIYHYTEISGDDFWWGDESAEETVYWDITFKDDNYHTLKIERASDEVVYHTLDERYIPNSIARKSSVDKKTGEKVEGRVFLIDSKNVTAQVGAEIFNEYSNNINQSLMFKLQNICYYV